MKRVILSLVALLLALSMLLVGCNEEPPTPDGNTPPSDNGEQNPPAGETAFTKTESYMPSAVYAQMKAYFEGSEKGFELCDDRANAPFVSTDVFAISDCKVKSITIPVFRTTKADKDGNFTFSLYVLPREWTSLREALKVTQEPITVTLNADEYGLEENALIRKFVKVDLSKYDITLSDKETLGFSHNDDTLIPARVLSYGKDSITNAKYVPAKYMIDNWDVMGYYYHDTAIDSETNKEKGFTYTDNSLFFDFELERTYESEAAYTALQAAKAQDDADYAEKLAAVKAAYGDKCFSLIGDSISTFNGVTNDPNVNATLSKNRVYYTANTTVYDYTKTYWGKLSVDTGMDLCVINAWSGGKCYGDEDDLVDNILTRSYNLKTNAGKSPDVIFLYYAINDMLNSPSSANGKSESDFTGNLPAGNLYQRLAAENKTQTDKEIVEAWFAEVQREASLAGYDPERAGSVKPGETYITWEGAYALALQNIKRLYGDAEVFVFTLAECHHGSSGQPRLDKANTILRALAEYFEVGLVDQSKGEINKENCHMYARDAYGLHPNGKGHAAITKLIVETLYEKLPK